MYVLSKACYLQMLSARIIQQKEIKVEVQMKASNKVLINAKCQYIYIFFNCASLFFMF